MTERMGNSIAPSQTPEGDTENTAVREESAASERNSALLEQHQTRLNLLAESNPAKFFAEVFDRGELSEQEQHILLNAKGLGNVRKNVVLLVREHADYASDSERGEDLSEQEKPPKFRDYAIELYRINPHTRKLEAVYSDLFPLLERNNPDFVITALNTIAKKAIPPEFREHISFEAVPSDKMKDINYSYNVRVYADPAAKPLSEKPSA